MALAVCNDPVKPTEWFTIKSTKQLVSSRLRDRVVQNKYLEVGSSQCRSFVAKPALLLGFTILGVSWFQSGCSKHSEWYSESFSWEIRRCNYRHGTRTFTSTGTAGRNYIHGSSWNKRVLDAKYARLLQSKNLRGVCSEHAGKFPSSNLPLIFELNCFCFSFGWN